MNNFRVDKGAKECYIHIMTATQSRNIISSEGGEPFAVYQHIILRNGWEYYLEEADGDGYTFGYVMGFENEWGSVSMDEIKPYIVSCVKGSILNEIMPPEGYYWEDEKELAQS